MTTPTIEGNLRHYNPIISTLKDTCGINLTSIMNDLVLETQRLGFEIARTEGQICFDCLYMVHNISPLLHRLLSIPSKVTTSELDNIPEVLRLTCIIYIITIRFAFGIFTVRAIMQLEKLKSILITWEEARIVRDTWENIGCSWLEAWVFATGLAASQNVVETREWFQSRFLTTLKNMEWTKEEFTKYISGFLWIDSIHGSIFK